MAKLESEPTLICDTGHNVGGISYIIEQLKHQKYERLHIVIGMVNDKDISGVLSMLPKMPHIIYQSQCKTRFIRKRITKLSDAIQAARRCFILM